LVGVSMCYYFTLMEGDCQ